MSASDCLRNFCGRYDGIRIDNVGYNELRTIADHIDAEMVELPKDADGVPIHVGDTVYLEDCSKTIVHSIDLMADATNIVCWVRNRGYVPLNQSDFTHEYPDSWERIAAEIDEMADGDDYYPPESIRKLADRIRKLAKKEGE